MHSDEYWIIENYEYKRCSTPGREFRSAASLHNHSMYSVENLASLNRVITLPVMRHLKGILQASFGLSDVRNLDYADIHYNPPLTPSQVLDLELANVQQIGFDSLLFALTDHNDVSGGPELLESPHFKSDKIGLGEELSVVFRDHMFHLGVVGLPSGQLTSVHGRLQDASLSSRLDELFAILRTLGCLVVLNHPLLPWDGGSMEPARTVEFLKRFGQAIHALEYNGMRSLEENDAVLHLARDLGKPVLGGGDSHLLTASSALGVSRGAESISEYIQEVKEGKAITLIQKNYYAPLGWKIFLRVLTFIAHYREIGLYKERSIEKVIGKNRILLDPIGKLARVFLKVTAKLGLIR
jgi:hypothetical protein